MKKIKEIILILIIVMPLINACTMKKRTYRAGYYVEWIGKKKPVPDINSLPNDSKIAQGLSTKTTKVELTTIESVNESEITEIITDPSTMPELKKTDGIGLKANETKNFHKEDQLTENHAEQIKQNEDSNAAGGEGGSGVGKGLLAMLLGLLLVLIGYLFYVSLGVFGLVLFWIFAIGGAIYFLVGLFMLL